MNLGSSKDLTYPPQAQSVYGNAFMALENMSYQMQLEVLADSYTRIFHREAGK